MEESNEERKKSFEAFIDSEDENWSEFLMAIRGASEDNIATREWDQDLLPVLFVDGTFPHGMPGVEEAAWGQRGLLVLGLAGDFMKSVESKEFLASMIFSVAVKTKATGLALLHTCWMSIVDKVSPEDGESDEAFAARCKAIALAQPPPSEDPNRIEKLLIQSYQYGGEDDGCKTAFADIKREEGKPPVLTNWKLTSEMMIEGRFADAMKAGLDIAWRMRAEEETNNEGEEWKSK